MSQTTTESLGFEVQLRGDRKKPCSLGQQKNEVLRRASQIAKLSIVCIIHREVLSQCPSRTDVRRLVRYTVWRACVYLETEIAIIAILELEITRRWFPVEQSGTPTRPMWCHFPEHSDADTNERQ